MKAIVALDVILFQNFKKKKKAMGFISQIIEYGATFYRAVTVENEETALSEQLVIVERKFIVTIFLFIRVPHQTNQKLNRTKLTGNKWFNSLLRIISDNYI